MIQSLKIQLLEMLESSPLKILQSDRTCFTAYSYMRATLKFNGLNLENIFFFQIAYLAAGKLNFPETS